MPNDLPDVPKVKKDVEKRLCLTGDTLHLRTTNLVASKSLSMDGHVKDKRSLHSLGLMGGVQKTKIEKVQKEAKPNSWIDRFDGTCCERRVWVGGGSHGLCLSRLQTDL